MRHFLAPFQLVVPTGQERHCSKLMAPLNGLYVPGGHGTHREFEGGILKLNSSSEERHNCGSLVGRSSNVKNRYVPGLHSRHEPLRNSSPIPQPFLSLSSKRMSDATLTICRQLMDVRRAKKIGDVYFMFYTRIVGSAVIFCVGLSKETNIESARN